MVAKSIKHQFQSVQADGGDTTVVRPSNWNADHNFFFGSRTVTTTSDTIADTDNMSVVVYNSASAVAVTLPQAGASSQFLTGWSLLVRNRGAGTVTITPTTSTINEAATLVLQQGDWAEIFSDGTNYNAQYTATIFRDGANTVAVRNGTSAQTFSVYNTFTDASNYERADIGWSGNLLSFGSANAGTGTARDVAFKVGGTERFRMLAASGTVQMAAATVIDINGGPLAHTSQVNYGASNDAGLWRTAAAILNVSDGTSNANIGWLISTSNQRLTADLSVASNTTLQTSGLQTGNMVAGRNYSFFACLFFTTGASAGGIKIGLGSGGATVSTLIADGICMDGTTPIACSRRSAFGAGNEIVAATNAGTAPVLYLFGLITCLAGGAMTIRFAQNVSNATASVIKAGSFLIVQDIP